MATAQQIIALLNSHVQGDQEQFLIALQVAAGEARSGRKDTADQLRRLVQAARNEAAAHWVRPSDGCRRNPDCPATRRTPDATVGPYPKLRLSQMVLDDATVKCLNDLLSNSATRLLRQHGEGAESSRTVARRASGSGKTMTAAAIAEECMSRYSPFGWTRLSPAISARRPRSCG